jgi:hypothetical protein
VHAPTEEKSDHSKDNFYEESEQVFDHFPKYLMQILLRDFNAKLATKDTFKPTTGSKNLHEDSNDNDVRVVNFAHQNILLLKARCSRTEIFINTPGPLLMGRHIIRSITY